MRLLESQKRLSGLWFLKQCCKRIKGGDLNEKLSLLSLRNLNTWSMVGSAVWAV